MTFGRGFIHVDGWNCPSEHTVNIYLKWNFCTIFDAKWKLVDIFQREFKCLSSYFPQRNRTKTCSTLEVPIESRDMSEVEVIWQHPLTHSSNVDDMKLCRNCHADQ